MNDEMMQAWMKVAAPAEEHEFLKRLAGDWKASTTFWMAPDAPPATSDGTMKGVMLLGDRFLQSTYEGDTPWGPFSGMAIDGYDRIRNVHVGIWMDSMGTVMMNFEGSAEGDVRTMTCNFTSPTGEPATMRGITTIVSDNEYRYESYASGPDGSEFKNMEIVYTR